MRCCWPRIAGGVPVFIRHWQAEPGETAEASDQEVQREEVGLTVSNVRRASPSLAHSPVN